MGTWPDDTFDPEETTSLTPEELAELYRSLAANQTIMTDILQVLVDNID